MSWTEGDEENAGAVVGRATLEIETADQWVAGLKDVEVIWRQTPRLSGNSDFSQHIAVSPDGRYLFVSSGDRGEPEAAHDLSTNLGKIVRLNLDGTPAVGNPFSDVGAVEAEVWSYGHNDPAGLAFDADGNLWAVEPAATGSADGSNRLNLIVAGGDYAWLGVDGSAVHLRPGGNLQLLRVVSWSIPVIFSQNGREMDSWVACLRRP